MSVDTIDVLTLLSMGDFFVEVKKPSKKATEALHQTLSLSAKDIENLFGQGEHDVARWRSEVAVRSSVGQCRCGRVQRSRWTKGDEASLAKYIEVPESCSAEVDVIREMASMIKTEVLTELSVTNKRLHQTASDFVDCNTLTIQVSTWKSHTSCRKQRHAENDVSMACEMF